MFHFGVAHSSHALFAEDLQGFLRRQVPLTRHSISHSAQSQMDPSLNEEQRALCARIGAAFSECDMRLKVGVSLSVKSGARPLNGMRTNADPGTTGWFIWAGEQLSEDSDFFVPLHGEHLKQWAPLVLPYLALPAGWRFLIAEDYEDVWQDFKLLSR